MLMQRLLKPENLLLFLVLLLICFFLYAVNQILAPFLIAIFIAYLLDPVADFLESKRLSRTLAVSLIFLVLSILIIATLVFVIPLLFKQIAAFIHQLPETLNWVYKLSNQLAIQHFNYTLPEFDAAPMKALLTNNWQTAGSFATQMATHFGAPTLKIIALIANLLLVPVVAFYLLRDWDHILEKIPSLIPDDYKAITYSLSSACDEALSAFIRGQLMVMLALACVYSIGLSVVGLQLALLLGVVAGLASIVPYLGVVVGVVSASLAAYFQFQTLNPVMAVLAVFIIGQILESVIFTPIFVGDKIGLHPVVVIFAIMAGGELAGFTGILIALPVSAVLLVLIQYSLKQYRQSVFFKQLNSTPTESHESEKHTEIDTNNTAIITDGQADNQ